MATPVPPPPYHRPRTSAGGSIPTRFDPIQVLRPATIPRPRTRVRLRPYNLSWWYRKVTYAIRRPLIPFFFVSALFNTRTLLSWLFRSANDSIPAIENFAPPSTTPTQIITQIIIMPTSHVTTDRLDNLLDQDTLRMLRGGE